jgi:hypothetical protein
MEMLAGADFFTIEVLTWRGLVTYYVYFFRRNPKSPLMVGRNHASSGFCMDGAGGAECDAGGGRVSERLPVPVARSGQEVLPGVRDEAAGGAVHCVSLPTRRPNLNAHAERWVRSIKEECLSRTDHIRGDLAAVYRVRIRRALSGERNH